MQPLALFTLRAQHVNFGNATDFFQLSRRVKKLDRADFQPALRRGLWMLTAVQTLNGSFYWPYSIQCLCRTRVSLESIATSPLSMFTPPVRFWCSPVAPSLPVTGFSSGPVSRMHDVAPCCCASMPPARTVPDNPHGGRPVVAGYIACNAFSSGCQSKVRSSRSRKSFVGVAIIRLSKSPGWGLVVVCISVGRLIHIPSFKTFAEIPLHHSLYRRWRMLHRRPAPFSFLNPVAEAGCLFVILGNDLSFILSQPLPTTVPFHLRTWPARTNRAVPGRG